MFRTRVCEILGIEYPIIQAPMNWVTSAELVAAVSNSGGLGTLGPNAEQMTGTNDLDELEERWRTVIKKTKQLTSKPFAVNISASVSGPTPFSDRVAKAAIEEGVQVAVTIMGPPSVYTQKLKNAGMKVLHAGSAVRHARSAEEAGVDAIVLECVEGGGHSGPAKLTNFALLPQAANAVKIPIIAAGGITDGRQFLAALALGAEGVYVGTRYMATHECRVHPKVKELMLKAVDNSTSTWGTKVNSIARGYRNAFLEKYLEMEMSGATVEELHAFEGQSPMNRLSRTYAGLMEGDTEQGTLFMGAGAGLIKELLHAGEVIPSIVSEAAKVLERMPLQPETIAR